MEYLFVSDKAVFKVKTPMWGTYALYNTASAALCALELGISPAVIRGALGHFGGARGRMELVGDVMIDFAHTPAALEGALKTAREVTRGRLISVFGCGGDRDCGKRFEMGAVAARLSDLTVITSDNPRSEEPFDIIREIERGFLSVGGEYTVICDREAAIRYAVGIAKDGDRVIVCGKGHEDYVIDKNGKRKFDERAIISDAIKRSNVNNL